MTFDVYFNTILSRFKPLSPAVIYRSTDALSTLSGLRSISNMAHSTQPVTNCPDSYTPKAIVVHLEEIWIRSYGLRKEARDLHITVKSGNMLYNLNSDQFPPCKMEKGIWSSTVLYLHDTQCPLNSDRFPPVKWRREYDLHTRKLHDTQCPLNSIDSPPPVKWRRE